MVIPYKYKNFLNNLIDSLNIEFLEISKSKNAPISARLDLEGIIWTKMRRVRKKKKAIGKIKKNR